MHKLWSPSNSSNNNNSNNLLDDAQIRFDAIKINNLMVPRWDWWRNIHEGHNTEPMFSFVKWTLTFEGHDRGVSKLLLWDKLLFLSIFFFFFLLLLFLFLVLILPSLSCLCVLCYSQQESFHVVFHTDHVGHQISGWRCFIAAKKKTRERERAAQEIYLRRKKSGDLKTKRIRMS
jgi:hypothetical protein